MTYDSPDYLIRRETRQSGVAGAASAAMAKFLFFQAAKLKAVHALVQTAGTNTDAGFDVYVGTNSVGAVVFGTNTAGSVVHSGALNAAVPDNGVVELKGKAASATAVVAVSLEYEVTNGAQET